MAKSDQPAERYAQKYDARTLAGMLVEVEDARARDRARLAAVERERDKAIAKCAQHVEHINSLTAERDRLREDLSVAFCSVASGVWFWQGEGDRPESLACPVVMSADALRTIVRERDEARATVLRELMELLEREEADVRASDNAEDAWTRGVADGIKGARVRLALLPSADAPCAPATPRPRSK